MRAAEHPWRWPSLYGHWESVGQNCRCLVLVFDTCEKCAQQIVLHPDLRRPRYDENCRDSGGGLQEDALEFRCAL